jgi:general secretion pathway protein F
MRYELKALDASGNTSRVTLDALSELEAREQARREGLTVLRVRAAGSGWLPRMRGRFPLVLFSQELTALLEAGLSLVESLQALAEKHRGPEAHPVLAHLLAQLYRGLPLSRALAEMPEAFPRLYVEMVRSSERTGDLAGALARFVSYQGQVDRVRTKIVTASIYPMILLGVGGLVTLFLLGYVVPKFSAIYVDLGREQPFLSGLLMQFGQFIGEHGQWLLLGIVATVSLVAYAASRPGALSAFAAWLGSLPALGPQMRMFQLARFYRTLGMLLTGGIPIVTALEMVAGLLDARLRPRLVEAARAVREGRPLSVSMEEHDLTTPIAARLLRVGERTGEMGTMMERIAAFHDDEISRWVDRFTRMFEPLLMAAIGVVIGVIVMALYMPIFDLAGSLQ